MTTKRCHCTTRCERIGQLGCDCERRHPYAFDPHAPADWRKLTPTGWFVVPYTCLLAMLVVALGGLSPLWGVIVTLAALVLLRVLTRCWHPDVTRRVRP